MSTYWPLRGCDGMPSECRCVVCQRWIIKEADWEILVIANLDPSMGSIAYVHAECLLAFNRVPRWELTLPGEVPRGLDPPVPPMSADPV